MILLRGLLQVALDNGKVLGIVNRLHHEPGERLLVLRVDGRGFEELGVELGDGFLVRLGAEVYYRNDSLLVGDPDSFGR